eukprot:6567107-Alexandrium_andersonii.AAC.1
MQPAAVQNRSTWRARRRRGKDGQRGQAGQEAAGCPASTAQPPKLPPALARFAKTFRKPSPDAS